MRARNTLFISMMLGFVACALQAMFMAARGGSPVSQKDTVLSTLEEIQDEFNEVPCAKKERLGHLLHHQGLALDEEMLHEERVQDRERAATEAADPYGHGPAPRRGDPRG